MRIRKAVIPVAGLGTRMLPATKSIPKELVPVAGKPAIQWAVEGAVASGIEEIILVTSAGKSAIEIDLTKPRGQALVADLAAELGVDPDQGPALAGARSALVLASAAGGLSGPVDGVTGDRKSTRLNSSHIPLSRMPSSA